ncbi:terminase large subunit domain-containing protein [Promicromonospora xylanilytica]
MAFAEEYLRVPKGTGALQPFVLRDWQIEIVRQLYPMADECKRPRQALMSIARGNGKTGLAAVLAAYALFADDEEGAQILVVASDERQAGMVYRSVKRMIELDERLSDQAQIYADRIYLPNTDSELRTLPADEGALQGWDPSLMIVDELHVVTEKVWEAVTTASGKRAQSLTFAISTPSDSAESVMWRLVQHGRSGTDPGFVFIEYAAPEGCAIDDEEAWAAANPALDDFLHRDAIHALLPPKTRESAFRRYRLGQWAGMEDSWLPFGIWEPLAAPRKVDPKTPVVLAFDGSASGDSTALIGCTLEPVPYVFVVDIWANPGDDRWRVPRAEVSQAVDAAFDRFNVQELQADPWGWRSEIEAWAKTHGEKKVMEWNTGAAARMAPATDRLYQAIGTGRVTHDGDERLTAHMQNAVAKPTPMGDLVKKDKRMSKHKIDAAVAAIVAFDRAAWLVHNKPKRKVVTW